MGITDPATIEKAYADLDGVLARIAALDYTGLGVRQLLELQSRREMSACAAAAVDHRILAALTAQSTPQEIGAKNWAEVLSIRLRISRPEARRRVRDAENLGPRTGLTGEALPPRWESAATAQTDGAINTDHIGVIGHFIATLPNWVDLATAAQCEATLVAGARRQSPEDLRSAADQLRYLLDQDGPEPDDAERARRRSFRIGKQQPDGMSKVDGWLDPAARATLDAALDKLAAPGMNNPADEAPCTSGTPSQAQIDADTRSLVQRTHDGIAAIGRIALGTGLGEHNGLPVAIVATTTLADLERRAGYALTHTGTKLPIGELIRLAAGVRTRTANGAGNYLAIFDNHTSVPLYLGRARRTASVGQRLVLFARDRGCTKPNCTAPASRCEAHHAVDDWRNGGQTNIGDLALACGCDNRLADTGGWTTTMGRDGRAHWAPPPLLDTGQPRTNSYHHPTLYPAEDDDETDSPAT